MSSTPPSDRAPTIADDAALIATARDWAARFGPETGGLFVAVEDDAYTDGRLRDVSGDDSRDAGLPSDQDVAHLLRRLAERLDALSRDTST